jgi:hypothetical protein
MNRMSEYVTVDVDGLYDLVKCFTGIGYRWLTMRKIIHACVSAVSGIINILQMDFVQQPDRLIQDMGDYVL